MTKQRRKQRNRSFGNMSFIERAGLIFGIVGLLADFTVLFTFATGVSNLNQYIPKSIPTPSALLFFSLTTGLIIIYGWFALSWYLVRRSFVLLGQMPVRFRYPLVGRSLRTVSGVGFILIPLMIAWSAVNVSNEFMWNSSLFPVIGNLVTVTPNSSITESSETAMTPSVASTPQTVYMPASDEEKISSGRFSFYMFCFPVFILVFGFVVWFPINLLMPIVHVELLLEEASPDIMDELREYLEQND